MAAPTRRSVRDRGGRWPEVWHGALALLVALCFIGPARSQEPAREEGLFITVGNPITRDVVNRVKMSVERALELKERPVKKFVFDFNASGQPSSTREYGDCRDLAAYLNRLRQVKTIAFVHAETTGHTVLPVLACQEIVMSSQARLGDVLHDQHEPLDDDQVKFYENLARGRRPPAIVYKMLDKDLEVVAGRRLEGGAKAFLDKRKVAEEQAKGIFVLPGQQPVLPRGTIGLYSAAEAQDFGLCDLVKETRADIVEAYQLTPQSLRGDPLEGREPVAERVVVNEPITKAFAETLRRRIKKSLGRRANVLIFQLECNGGDTLVANDLAVYLRGLKDDSGELPVMTIAYIPERAPGAATFLAFGCTEIVMGRRAEIGDFENVLSARPGGPFRMGKAENDQPDRANLLRDSLVALAQEQGYPALVAQGMLDRNLTIYQVRSRKGHAETRLVTEEELAADKEGRWDKETKRLIKPGGPAGKLLKLDANLAKELGIARRTVENLPELYEIYGIKKVRDAGFDFLSELAAFLRHPLVAVFLIMLGIACLILELKMPGVGLPGVIAALCFVLYFWAQSQLAGQIIMLAILLFILGLVLLGLEIFVLPGFGVAGISGIVLVVLSLGLATLEKKPETTAEWLSFGRTLSAVGLSLLGAVVLAVVGAWYLPSIPWAGRLVLKAPADARGAAEDELLANASVGDPTALLGAMGVAATTLRPAGIARFGDDFVDVVTEGSFVEAGTRVQVVEIEGNRVVVKEV